MSESEERLATQLDFDPTQDRYADINKAIALAMDSEDWPEGPVERFEVTCLASGEVTFRVWPVRAVEPIGGHFTGT